MLDVKGCILLCSDGPENPCIHLLLFDPKQLFTDPFTLVSVTIISIFTIFILYFGYLLLILILHGRFQSISLHYPNVPLKIECH